MTASATIRLSLKSSKFEHVLHHRSDPIKNLVDRSVAHEGTGGDQLVLLVHVALADTLAHVLTAQLVDGRGSASCVRVPKHKVQITVKSSLAFCHKITQPLVRK